MAMTSLDGILGTFDRWGIPYLADAMVPGHPRGTFAPRFVMLHDTVGPAKGAEPSHRIVREGRPPKVPGPLYQLVLRRDLVVDVVTYGRANHSGEGGPWRSRGAGSDGIPTNLGNRLSVGVSWEHTGHPGDPWDPSFVSFGVLVTAAVCDFLGVPGTNVLGHKEYTDRKIDPVDMRMGSIRSRVVSMLESGPRPGPRPEEPEDDDMKVTDPIEITPSLAKILGRTERTTTVGELISLQTAAGIVNNRLLVQVRERLDALIAATPDATPPADSADPRILGEGL